MTHAQYFPTTLLVLPQGVSHEQAVHTYCESQHGKLHPSQYHWIDGAEGSIGIEAVRQLQTALSFAQAETVSVHTLLHAENTTLPAQHALLKILEEPPAWVQCVVTTTDEHRLLPTILSRCHRVLLSSLKSAPVDPSKLETILHILQTAPHHELISLAEQHKTKEEGIALLTNLITYLHTKIISSNQNDLDRWVKWEQVLLEHRGYLQANANVRLVLENCFFALRAS